MIRNKKIALFALVIIVATISFMIPRFAASRILTNVPADISEDELRAVVVEDFEKATVGETGWDVKSTPKQMSQEGEKKLKQGNPVPTLAVKLVDGAPSDMGVDEGKTKVKCLGVNFQFRYPGPNSIHVIAPLEVTWKDRTPAMTYKSSTGKSVQERGIQLPGQSKAISMWVHGRGNPYDMEIWLTDYRGDTHVLRAGSVNFVGWRPVKVKIPIYIPQSYASYPQTRVTKISRIVFRAQTSAHAEELTENTYFFIDQIKVLTDLYEVNFDGMDMHKVFEGKSQSGEKTNK